MELYVNRTYKKDTYVIGRLYINGRIFCNTLEDKDRGLSSSMTEEEIKSKKVYGKTAIPTGIYEIDMETVSPKFNKKAFYKNVCGGKVPRLKNVKGFEGILIHVADGPKGADLLEGCIGIGSNTIVGGLTNGKQTFISLYTKLREAYNKGEKITIEIK